MKKIKLWQIIILIFAITFVNINPVLIYADELENQILEAPPAEALGDELSADSQEGEQPPSGEEQPPGEGEQLPSEGEQPPGEAEQPPSGEEVIDDEEIPQGPVDPDAPPVDPDAPPVDPDAPPVDPDAPPVDPNAPPVDPNAPPVDPNAPPVDPNAPVIPPVIPPVVPPIIGGGGGGAIPPINVIPGEEILVTKTANRADVYPGETIIYTIEVVNQAGVDILGLTIEDPMINLVETFDLLAGESKGFTGEFVVQKPEPVMVAGEEFMSVPNEPPVIVNTVRVYGAGPVGEIEETATAVVNGVLEEVMSEEFIEDPGEIYLDLSEFDSQPMMRSFQMLTVNPYENDHLSIDKTATTLDLEERIYQVDFEITGTPPEKPVDVILVIDASGSMGYRIPGDSKAPLYYAKQSAISFANSIIDENPDSRVGVVAFSGGQYGYSSDAWTVSNLTNDKTSLMNNINNITTHNMTNIQAGFRLALNKINAIPGTRDSVKSVVFLTDGVANVSIGHWASNDPVAHNTHTIAAYTEGQSLYSYINGNLFTIGLFGAITNNSVKSIARDTLQKSINYDSGKYYEATSAVDLGPVYDTISQKLEYAATNASVVDFMSIPVNDHFEVITGSISTSRGTATYNSTSKKIEWIIGDIREETLTMSYVIRVIDDMWPTAAWPSNWSSLDTNGPFGYENEPNSGLNPVDTNSSATLNYKNPSNVVSSMNFPMPKVPVPPVLRLNIEKIINGIGLDKEFEINIAGSLLNESNMNFNHFTKGGTHKFWGLKQGDYTATENYLPYNYEKVSISAPVRISYSNPEDTITVTNKPKTTGWFYDDDEKKNNFYVGIVTMPDMTFDSKKIEIAND